MSLRALARANALGWIVLILLAGCGGRRQALELESAPRAIDPAEYSLVELDKRPAPDGVNAETWTALKAALRAALGGNRQSSALGLRLTDFPIANLAAAPYSGGAAQLTWTYAGSGDYDLNGAVTISDITPLARYFGAKATDVDWSSARVADGNRPATWASKQSEGTTSNPAPGSSVTPAARASASRPASASSTSISPVMSR